MHVAAAVGCPTVGIFPFQSDFPERWAPLGERTAIVRAAYPCHPGDTKERCRDYACIANLDDTQNPRRARLVNRMIASDDSALHLQPREPAGAGARGRVRSDRSPTMRMKSCWSTTVRATKRQRSSSPRVRARRVRLPSYGKRTADSPRLGTPASRARPASASFLSTTTCSCFPTSCRSICAALQRVPVRSYAAAPSKSNRSTSCRRPSGASRTTAATTFGRRTSPPHWGRYARSADSTSRSRSTAGKISTSACGCAPPALGRSSIRGPSSIISNRAFGQAASRRWWRRRGPRRVPPSRSHGFILTGAHILRPESIPHNGGWRRGGAGWDWPIASRPARRPWRARTHAARSTTLARARERSLL